MRDAVAKGEASGNNLVQLRAGGGTVEFVCASVRDGKNTLASLFADASTSGRVTIEDLDGIDESELEIWETARPLGYSSQTMLRFGGLEVVALLDSGATCSASPEEVAVSIISHAMQQVDKGS